MTVWGRTCRAVAVATLTMLACALAASPASAVTPSLHVHEWVAGTQDAAGHNGATSATRAVGSTVAIVGVVHSASHAPVSHYHVRWTLSGTPLAHLDSAGTFTGASGVTEALLSSDFDANGATSILSFCPDGDSNLACDIPATTVTITWGSGSSAATAISAMAVTPAIAVVGSTFAISGTLTHNFEPVAGQIVQLQRRVNGAGQWVSMGGATTNPAGTFVVHDTPTFNTDYRAVFVGADALGAATSPVVRALVRAGISMVPATATPLAGHAVRMSGLVTPAHPGAHVGLQAYSPLRGWQTIARATLSPASTFGFSVVSSSARSLLYRAIYETQAGSNAWNVTPAVRVTWR